MNDSFSKIVSECAITVIILTSVEIGFMPFAVSESEESYLEDLSSYKLHGRLKTEIHYFSDIYKTFMA